MSGAVDAVRAYREGRAAAAAGSPATACPYAVDAETVQEQALGRMWLRGYDRVNSMPVDHSG